MNNILKYTLRGFILMLLQILIFNKIEVGYGVLFLVYPLFIFLLPQNIKIGYLLLIAFFYGFILDTFSNTYGLHASSLVLFAYLKPVIFNSYKPRDDYDALIENNMYTYGKTWYLFTYGILIFSLHFWYFFLESFRFDLILWVLLKTILSSIIALLLGILLQNLLIQNPNER